MPRSDPSTHRFLRDAVRARLRPGERARVLDCGVGAGAIADALRTIRHLGFHGIEIFAPYVLSRDKQAEVGGPFFHDLYDRIDLGDFAQLLPEVAAYDFIIFGDSLMQLPPDRAEHALSHALRKARRAVLVNATLVPYDQGPAYGNPHERHLLSWPREVFTAFGAEFLGGNDQVGAFVFDLPTCRARASYLPLGFAEQREGSRFDARGALRHDDAVDPLTLRTQSLPPRPDRCLIAVAHYGRRETARRCVAQLGRTRGAATLWLYDDASPDFDASDFESSVDRVIRLPVNRGIDAVRLQNLRDFWVSDFDYLYLTDNDAYHDPEWLTVALQLYARYGVPVTLFDTVFHREVLSVHRDGWMKRSFPGISIFLDRAAVARVLRGYDAGDRRGGALATDLSWDWVYGDLLGNRIFTSNPSRVDHYGAGGLHNQDHTRDAALHPSPFLAAVRASGAFD